MVSVSSLGTKGPGATSTPNDGADFGPDTPGTTTQGVKEALAAAGRSGGGTVSLGAGTFVFPDTCFIPSKVVLQLNGSTLTMGADQPAFRTAPGSSGIRLTGSGRIDGAGRNERFFYVVNATDFASDATLEVARMGHPNSAFLVRNSRGVRFVGKTTSSDSAILRFVDCSDVEAANIDCTYARDPEGVPVGVFGSTPMSGIHLHHLHVNGGGLRKKPLLIVAPDQTGPKATNIAVEDVVLENPPTTTEFHDGLDVTHCEGVTVERVSGSWLNLVVNLNTSKAVARFVRAHDCWGPALQVGDPTFMKESIADVRVEDCEIQDSGRGYPGIAGSGLGVYCTPGFTVQNVEFHRCVSVDTRRVQPFGFAVMKGASHVIVEGCRFAGTKGSVWNDAGPSAVSFQNSTV
jgi:hypothetical protein